MNKRGASSPYQTLGSRLKGLRVRRHQSLQEVSGAVEIDADKLDQIEKGIERPSEDILVLLINYFNLPARTASRLWTLAGYDKEELGDNRTEPNPQQAVMMIAMGLPTMYSDGVEIITTQSGVTMNFTHGAGNPAVAKVGMSYAQAASVLQTLETALLKAKYLSGPRQLPEAVNPKPHKSQRKPKQ